MTFPKFEMELPAWVADFLPSGDEVYPTEEERMKLVISLARMNIEKKTGGPFGAAIFDMESDKLIAPGVNLVMSSNCSVLHAEIVAIMIAQRITGYFDLGGEGIPSCELVTSTEPCAMCLGAVPWSGVSRLVCGARGDDAAMIGFDEGTKPAYWQHALESRGIEVVRDIYRSEAARVLRDYQAAGGLIYNGSDRRS